MPEPLIAADVAKALREAPTAVQTALVAVSPEGTIFGLAEYNVLFLLDYTTKPDVFADHLVKFLNKRNLIDGFSAVLRSEAAPVISPEMLRANQSTPIEFGRWFYARTTLSRCRIHVNGVFAGSGFLVGPSLVLTCAHVIEASNDDLSAVEVVLDSGQRLQVRSPAAAISPPAAADRILPISTDDAAYPSNDFALLRMVFPVGADLAIISLGSREWEPTADAAVLILHLPEGKDEGVGNGVLARFALPSARWSYRAPTLPGSSGGACFNSHGQLIGLHQGSLSQGKRMIPLRRFASEIVDRVAADLKPSGVWSTDGKLEGTLAIGRRDLFLALNRMSERDSLFRILRIMRNDPAAGPDGLGFTVELVKTALAIGAGSHRVITLGWPTALFDQFDIVKALAQIAEIGLVVIDASRQINGIASGETGYATVVAAQADQLVRMLNSAAERNEQLLWIVIEHCFADLGRQTIALEALAAAVERWPFLRLVLVGNETVRLAGSEFTIDQLNLPNAPTGGTLLEFLRPLDRADIVAFIREVYLSFLGEPPPNALVKVWADKALAAGQASATDGKSPSQLIAESLRATLSTLGEGD
jgi:Trypsin-like peptidase domain